MAEVSTSRSRVHYAPRGSRPSCIHLWSARLTQPRLSTRSAVSLRLVACVVHPPKVGGARAACSQRSSGGQGAQRANDRPCAACPATRCSSACPHLRHSKRQLVADAQPPHQPVRVQRRVQGLRHGHNHAPAHAIPARTALGHAQQCAGQREDVCLSRHVRLHGDSKGRCAAAWRVACVFEGVCLATRHPPAARHARTHTLADLAAPHHYWTLAQGWRCWASCAPARTAPAYHATRQLVGTRQQRVRLVRTPGRRMRTPGRTRARTHARTHTRTHARTHEHTHCQCSPMFFISMRRSACGTHLSGS
jgi:hypothetical protein